ncbi:hypothetical protein [Candidatus Brocadia sapporoensis]|nr:hypothetical protein [Candidatus Brocadia sapporoensis]
MTMFTFASYTLFKEYLRNSWDAIANASTKMIRSSNASFLAQPGTFMP